VESQGINVDWQLTRVEFLKGTLEFSWRLKKSTNDGC